MAAAITTAPVGFSWSHSSFELGVALLNLHPGSISGWCVLITYVFYFTLMKSAILNIYFLENDERKHACGYILTK